MQLRPEGHSRGQVIIVAALVIATIFVGLALVLNSGIYAENLSSRETTDTEGALSFTLATNEAIAEAYERTNAAGEPTAADAAATFNGTVDSWETAQQRRGAMQGVGVDVERTAHVGWRLKQDTDREYMPAGESNTTDWTVAEDATNVSEFRFDAGTASLYDATLSLNDTSDRAFHLNVSDGTSEWEMYVFRENDAISGNDRFIIHVGNPDNLYSDIDDLVNNSPSSCDIVADRVVVDMRNETITDSETGSGTACDALAFEDDLDGDVTVRYENTYVSNEARIVGQYDLVVNGSVSTDGSGDPRHFNAPNDAAPTAQAVVYSASYASHYGRADLTFERHGTHAVREETYAS